MSEWANEWWANERIPSPAIAPKGLFKTNHYCKSVQSYYPTGSVQNYAPPTVCKSVQSYGPLLLVCSKLSVQNYGSTTVSLLKTIALQTLFKTIAPQTLFKTIAPQTLFLAIAPQTLFKATVLPRRLCSKLWPLVLIYKDSCPSWWHDECMIAPSQWCLSVVQCSNNLFCLFLCWLDGGQSEFFPNLQNSTKWLPFSMHTVHCTVIVGDF